MIWIAPATGSYILKLFTIGLHNFNLVTHIPPFYLSYIHSIYIPRNASYMSLIESQEEVSVESLINDLDSSSLDKVLVLVVLMLTLMLILGVLWKALSFPDNSCHMARSPMKNMKTMENGMNATV